MYVTATVTVIINDSCSETRLVEVIENLCENSEKEVSTESKWSVTVKLLILHFIWNISNVIDFTIILIHLTVKNSVQSNLI